MTECVGKNGVVLLYLDDKTVTTKQRYLYQKYHNCKLSKNELVIFLDGNRNNFAEDNLEKVTRGELALLNKAYKISSNPEETKVYLDIVRITLKRNELARKAGLVNKDGAIQSDRNASKRKYDAAHRKEHTEYLREYRRKKYMDPIWVAEQNRKRRERRKAKSCSK